MCTEECVRYTWVLCVQIVYAVPAVVVFLVYHYLGKYLHLHTICHRQQSIQKRDLVAVDKYLID